MAVDDQSAVLLRAVVKANDKIAPPTADHYPLLRGMRPNLIFKGFDFISFVWSGCCIKAHEAGHLEILIFTDVAEEMGLEVGSHIDLSDGTELFASGSIVGIVRVNLERDEAGRFVVAEP